MPDINDIYASGSNSNYLKVADLQGRRASVTIAGAELEDFKGKKQVVISFQESSKRLGLNKTNANTIAFLLGTPDYTQWAGKRITLRPDMTQYEGKPMPCIRIDSELPQQLPTQAAPAFNQSPQQGFGGAAPQAEEIPF